MRRFSAARWTRVCLALLACVHALTWASAPPSEYQVKAVFLFNFARFVTWPVTSFPASDAPFVIGVLGPDPFGAQLDNVVRGEAVSTHPFIVKRFGDISDVTDCNILFIGRTDPKRLEEILSALKGRSILTVSDADSSQPRGLMIGLFTDNNRIRMRIDVAAAKEGNLTISSNLLRPAQIVGQDPGQ